MDLALWDIKGKALGVPVHELLGGTARDYCECYATGGATPPGAASNARLSLKERARATMEAGYRAFRLTPADVPIGRVYDSRSFIRSTLPNAGGITEMMKIAAICETHAVGIVPHFTGPIATAALVNCLSTYSGPVLMEYNYGGRPIDYLPECLDFKNGKAYTNQRPCLGVTLDLKLLPMIGEATEPARRNVSKRPDGSLTHLEPRVTSS